MTSKNWFIPEKQIEAVQRDLQQAIAKEYFPEFFDQIKQELTNAMDKYIGEHLDGMSVDYDFNTTFEIDDNKAIGYIEIDVGKLKGTHEQHVRSHTRKGHQVTGHTRVLTDQAVFLDGDKTITSDTIPDKVIIESILAPVIEEYSDDKVTEADAE